MKNKYKNREMIINFNVIKVNYIRMFGMRIQSVAAMMGADRCGLR